jgi:ATP-dependent Clp protease ATP-binding subunit ClpC
VFERFTDDARRVVVIAQEEARLLQHDYIGTEHILLGLIREGESAGARALASLGVSLPAARSEVERMIGQRESPPTGHIPFTPRAKKVLELSLREALALGHNYIGGEHILLGLIREGEGIAAQVLVKLGADLQSTREKVLQVVGDPTATVETGEQVSPTERTATPGARCPQCRTPLAGTVEAVPLQAGDRSFVVVHCGWCGSTMGVLPA